MKSICPAALMLLAPLLVAGTVVSATPCEACCVNWCGWYATSSVPFALDSRLRGYYVPRRSACCGVPLYQTGHGGPCSCPDSDGAAADWPYAPETSDGLEPADFEHLGRIPNDLLLDGAR